MRARHAGRLSVADVPRFPRRPAVVGGVRVLGAGEVTVAGVPAGDLLCFIRGNGAPRGFAGLKAFLSSGKPGGLPMHCDIVVGRARGGQDLYLVGGNVLQGATLRILPLNRAGRLWSLPRGSTAACAPGNQGACSFNRQDWAALLKLKPQAELEELAGR